MEGQESKKISKEMNDFLIIGMGRFGISVATTLTQLGHEVLAVDTDPKNLKSVENVVSSVASADCSNIDVLKSLGAQNFDCAVVCIGDDIESSILITSLCKELGIDYVVAKAQNEHHKKILEKVGADMVVFPEVYMGKKLANMLSDPSVNEALTLTKDLKIVEVAMPESWVGKTVGGINVRKKFKVSIIYIKRGEEVITPEVETEFVEGDRLVVSGDKNAINNLSYRTNDSIDVNTAIGDALSTN